MTAPATAPSRPPPPQDRFCDLVMKGGVTSGVVYPKAVVELSHHYRFVNIGGTSVGAMAAALTAAAEYQRRTSTSDSRAGFEGLQALADQLEQRGLAGLFQPAAGCKAAFRLFNHVAQAGSIAAGLKLLPGGLLRAWPWIAFLAVIAGAAYGWLNAAPFAGVLVALVAWLGGTLLWAAWSVPRALDANGFGLCSGLPDGPPDAENPALTPWLHHAIQRLAGRGKDDPPLTLGDLWHAGGFPAWLYPHVKPADWKAINLQLFTTNVTHGRPCLLPFDGSEAPYCFDPKELARYFTADILQWLVDHGGPAPEVAGQVTSHLRRLPDAADLPVLFCARLSMSFPVLFSAVPLWTLDPRQDLGLPEAAREQPRLARCWFSDGGIGSNFPIHLFDRLVPVWPTFGIQLEDAAGNKSDRRPPADLVRLPRNADEGAHESWRRFDDEPAGGARVGSFLFAVLDAMHSWNDSTLCRMPGVRDRVLRVGLRRGEGGLNLAIDRTEIADMAARGVHGAGLIAERFLGPDGAVGPGWDEQRWMRTGVALSLLDERLEGLATALSARQAHATPIEDLLRNANGRLPGMQGRFDEAQVQELLAVLGHLRGWRAGSVQRAGAGAGSFRPVPRPDLRIRPAL